MKQSVTDSCSSCTKLAEQNKHYHTLISQISHEVRNPLTLICSSLQLIEKECPSVTAAALWPQLQQDVQDTIRLLNEISLLNRSTVCSSKVFSVWELLCGISVSFQPLMLEKQITFHASISSELQHYSAVGDPILLKEALWNLLLNAADAVSASPMVQGLISLTAAVDKDQLQIHIYDNGIGIPSEYLPTLFDPFVTHKSGGTGLGLCIAKAAAQQHKGSLTVKSPASAPFCTDFCLMLPVTAAATL